MEPRAEPSLDALWLILGCASSVPVGSWSRLEPPVPVRFGAVSFFFLRGQTRRGRWLWWWCLVRQCDGLSVGTETHGPSSRVRVRWGERAAPSLQDAL